MGLAKGLKGMKVGATGLKSGGFKALKGGKGLHSGSKGLLSPGGKGVYSAPKVGKVGPNPFNPGTGGAKYSKFGSNPFSGFSKGGAGSSPGGVVGSIVPGGANQIETLSNDLHVRRILRAFLRENEPVALAGVSTSLLTTIDAAKGRKIAASDADSALLIAAGAEIINKPTVRDKKLISATSGESGILDLLGMLAQAIKENNKE